MSRDLPHLAARLFGTPLLIDPRKLDAIVPAFLRRLNGDDDILPDGAEPREPGEPCIRNGVAIVPILGTLVRRKTMLDAFSGLTSYGDIRAAVQCGLDDARAKAIMLEIDTYGGEASGCFELCDWLFAQRGTKPIWAACNVDALSAGYAIAVQADRLLIAPSGSTASVGAVAVHCERSQLNEALGITYTVIRAGARKAEMTEWEPLTREAAAKVQGSLDKMRQTFVLSVARARPRLKTPALYQTQGQWFEADEALAMGLVDTIAPFDEVFAMLAAEVAAPAVAPIVPAVKPTDMDEDDISDDELPELQAAGEDDDGEDNGDDEDDDDNALLPEVLMTTETKPAVAAAATPAGTDNVVQLNAARDEGRAAALAEMREIGELCQIAGRPQLAAEFLSRGASVADVRKALIDARATADQAGPGEISNQSPGARQQEVNTAELWDKAFAKARAAYGPQLAEHYR